MHRHELSDEEWELLEPLLPSNEHHEGRPWGDHRRYINGMLWRLATGAPWRDVPEVFGNWISVYQRFNRWSKSGLLRKIAFALQARLNEKGYVDWSLWCLDGTIIKASKSAAGARHGSEKKSVLRV